MMMMMMMMMFMMMIRPGAAKAHRHVLVGGSCFQTVGGYMIYKIPKNILKQEISKLFANLFGEEIGWGG